MLRSSIFVLAFALLAPQIVVADPPPHAPAHGWRKKNDPYYVGYTGKQWERDYGIVGGRCNREAIGTVLGGAVGGAIGSTIGSGDGKVVAIIIGSVLGAVVGNQIGRQLDNEDRACIGHTLELVPDGRAVSWVNQTNGLSYVITPTKGFKQGGQSCREFTTVVSAKGKKETVKDRACRSGDGTWKIIG